MQIAFRRWCNIIFDNIYVSLFFRHLNIHKKQLWEIFPKAVFYGYYWLIILYFVSLRKGIIILFFLLQIV